VFDESSVDDELKLGLITGTVATPANCVTCAPFIDHTSTLPFAR
jgi:hypothetical protein